MGAFFWGIVGGAIVLLANKRAGLQTAAVSAGKAGRGGYFKISILYRRGY